MEQRSFYRVNFYQEVRERELEHILNSICQGGGVIIDIDIHPRGELRVVIEYNKEEHEELRRIESNTLHMKFEL